MTQDFLRAFKQATEARWSTKELNQRIYGFQFQRGTCWNPGLSESQITAYEESLSAEFPVDLRMFLGFMNGTDLPTVNVYGGRYETSEGIGVFSYPRDLDVIAENIQRAASMRTSLTETLADQGYTLPPQSTLVPIYSHRYVVCTPKANATVVLSIWDESDAIVYGDSLEEYLQQEFLPK